MAKEIFRDVIPANKKSIRRIPLSRPKKPVNQEVTPTIEEDEEEMPAPRRERPEVRREEVQRTRPQLIEDEYRYEEPKKKRFPRFILWTGGIVVALGVIALVMTTFFASATAKITPHVAGATVDADFVASETASKDAVAYKTIAVSDDFKEVMKARQHPEL